MEEEAEPGYLAEVYRKTPQWNARLSEAGRKALARDDVLMGHSTSLVLIAIMLFVLGVVAGMPISLRIMSASLSGNVLV